MTKYLYRTCPKCKDYLGVVVRDPPGPKSEITDYNKALEINPRLAAAYYNRAIVYLSTGQYDKAWEDVYKAQDLGVKIRPNLLKNLRGASGRQK